MTLSYLTTGLSWKADYVALFDEKQSTLRLQGWVTLTNTAGTSFKDAMTQLVAGDINVSDDSENNWQRQQQQRSSSRGGGTGGDTQAQIADYYLYPLPERVTIADNQTKQVGFIPDLPDVKAKKTYEFRTGEFDSFDQPAHVEVVLQFQNARTALPAGTMRVYMRDQAGEAKFIGENEVDHTPAGSDLAIKIGDAFDVTVQPTVVSSDKISDSRTRYAMSYAVRNALSVPVTVDLRQSGLWRNGKVETESLKSQRIDANTLGWDVPVPAHGETVLTFTVDAGD